MIEKIYFDFPFDIPFDMISRNCSPNSRFIKLVVLFILKQNKTHKILQKSQLSQQMLFEIICNIAPSLLCSSEPLENKELVLLYLEDCFSEINYSEIFCVIENIMKLSSTMISELMRAHQSKSYREGLLVVLLQIHQKGTSYLEMKGDNVKVAKLIQLCEENLIEFSHVRIRI